MGYTDNITDNFQVPGSSSRYSFSLAFQSFRVFLRKQNLRTEKFCCSIDTPPASSSAGTLRSVLASGGEYTPEITTAYFGITSWSRFPCPSFSWFPSTQPLLSHSCPAPLQAHTSASKWSIGFRLHTWHYCTNWKPSNSLLLGGLVHVKKSGNLAAKETFNLIPGCTSKIFASLLKKPTISELFSTKGTVDLSTGKLPCKNKSFGKTVNSQVSARLQP